MRDVRRIRGNATGQENRSLGCLPDDVRAWGIDADNGTNCGEIVGGIPHDKLDRGRESQGCITTCSSMPECDGKDKRDGRR